MTRLQLLLTLQADVLPEPNTGCWLWVGANDEAGEPTVQIDGVAVGVRGSLVQESMSGTELEPACDVSCCVNPDHQRVRGGKVPRRVAVGEIAAVAV